MEEFEQINPTMAFKFSSDGRLNLRVQEIDSELIYMLPLDISKMLNKCYRIEPSAFLDMMEKVCTALVLFLTAQSGCLHTTMGDSFLGIISQIIANENLASLNRVLHSVLTNTEGYKNFQSVSESTDEKFREFLGDADDV